MGVLRYHRATAPICPGGGGPQGRRAEPVDQVETADNGLDKQRTIGEG